MRIVDITIVAMTRVAMIVVTMMVAIIFHAAELFMLMRVTVHIMVGLLVKELLLEQVLKQLQDTEQVSPGMEQVKLVLPGMAVLIKDH